MDDDETHRTQAAYLGSLQQACGHKPMNLALLERLYLADVQPDQREQRRNRFRNAVEQLPTPYENVLNYVVLLELTELLEATTRHVGLPLPARPLIGTLPTGRTNALTIAAPSG